MTTERDARGEARCEVGREGGTGTEDGTGERDGTGRDGDGDGTGRVDSIRWNTILIDYTFIVDDSRRHRSSEVPAGGTTKTPNASASPSRYTLPTHP